MVDAPAGAVAQRDCGMVLPNVYSVPSERATDHASESASDVASDGVLVRRIAAGDKAAHRQLYERHGRAVLVFLVCRLDDAAVAEEVLQDVMLAVWQTAGRFAGRSAVRTWLFAIAHNHACNVQRRRKPMLLADGPLARLVDPAGAASQRGADRRLDLERAMADLQDDQRVALELFFFHGLDLDEIALVTGAPVGTVKSRLSRAKARLRIALSDDDAGAGGNDV